MQYFKHFNADSIKNAVSLLGKYGDEAKVITGGTDLVSLMKNHVIEPGALINIKTISGLDYIKEEDGKLNIGALTSIASIQNSSLVKTTYPILTETAHAVASPQLRNMSSLSGNLCQHNRCWYYRRGPDTGLTFTCRLKGGKQCYAVTGDNRYHALINGNKCFAVCPSDMATTLVALNASVRISSKAGERTITLEQLYSALPLGRLLAPDEIITEIIIPAIKTKNKQKFIKFALRKTIDFAIVSVAAITGDDKASIVVGGIAPAPFRATLAEQILRGKKLTPEVVEEASQAALNKAKPLSDNAYKLPIVRALIKRVILG